MTDTRTRELEREALQGNPEAAERWIRERVRAGEPHPREQLLRVLADPFMPHHFMSPCCGTPIGIGPAMVGSGFSFRRSFWCTNCVDRAGCWPFRGWRYPSGETTPKHQRIATTVQTMRCDMRAPTLVLRKGSAWRYELEPDLAIGFLDPDHLAPFPTKLLANRFRECYASGEQLTFPMDQYLQAPLWVALRALPIDTRLSCHAHERQFCYECLDG